MKNSSFFVVALFIGVAIAPGIQTDREKTGTTPVEIELVGIPTSEKYTVDLSDEQIRELQVLFEDIEQQLSNAQSRKEANEIVKDALSELEKYGLLGGLTLEQAQNLIIGSETRQRLLELMDDNYQDILDDNANYFCMITGRLTGTLFFNPFSLPRSIFHYYLYYLVYPFPKFIVLFYTWDNFISLYRESLVIHTTLLPVSFFSIVTAGHSTFGHYPYPYSRNYPSQGSITSFGIKNFKDWIGDLWGDATMQLICLSFFTRVFYPAILGFLGIKITINSLEDIYFAGFALKASFSNQLPLG
jgi:hypothetical protein